MSHHVGNSPRASPGILSKDVDVEPVIRARGLTKRYGEIQAVAGIDLDVQPGEAFGFLGPNGAGKSTTIGILCTLVQPTGGTASVAGCDVLRESGDVRARIGLVFQDPSLDDQLTARENLEFHAFVYNVPRSERRRRIDDALEMVELTDRASSLVKTYSGGMRRRLEIARGMLHHPQVLFLDEPTLGLDPQTRNHIWAYLERLRSQVGITVFMTTHYMDEAEFCDRIAIVDHGNIVALGTPDELKSQVGGDIVSVTTGDDDAAARQLETQFDLQPGRTAEGLRLEVDDGAAFVPRLVRELDVPVTTVSVSRPSLDDVFLKLTGRAIREEDADPRAQLRAFSARFAGRRR
jgi:ABC-2 type transport system ATP-binding protein